jgi:hypothetical protein
VIGGVDRLRRRLRDRPVVEPAPTTASSWPIAASSSRAKSVFARPQSGQFGAGIGYPPLPRPCTALRGGVATVAPVGRIVVTSAK